MLPIINITYNKVVTFLIGLIFALFIFDYLSNVYK